MKTKALSISIPESCPERWEDMTLCSSGRFCSRCEKTVVDFTGFSDGEIAAFFSRKENANTCGRFYAHQIENKVFPIIPMPVNCSYRTLAMAASVAVLTVISFSANAQDKRQKMPTTHSVLSTATSEKNLIIDSNFLVIEGVVKDEKHELLMHAILEMLDDGKVITSSASDLDGNFFIRTKFPNWASKSLSVRCRLEGYQDETIKLVPKPSINGQQTMVFTLKTDRSLKNNKSAEQERTVVRTINASSILGPGVCGGMPISKKDAMVIGGCREAQVVYKIDDSQKSEELRIGAVTSERIIIEARPNLEKSKPIWNEPGVRILTGKELDRMARPPEDLPKGSY